MITHKDANYSYGRLKLVLVQYTLDRGELSILINLKEIPAIHLSNVPCTYPLLRTYNTTI